MRVVGIGTDAAEIDRIVDLYERHTDAFMTRVFTAKEREYCQARKKNIGESLVARWAAKEAVMKALGVGWSRGVAWTDIEVESLPSGAPTLNITGRAKEIADELGVVDWQISLTHCKTLAIAFVVASAQDLP